MKIVFLAVGKKHDASISAAVEDFTARIGHYSPVEWVLIPAPRAELTPDESRRVESALILQKLSPDDQVILLDETGEQLTSPALSKMLEKHMVGGTKRLVFIIGGAFGVDETLKSRANFTWSLSKLVFPHQLVRLLLAEQAYRGFTILRGEKYHHV